MTDTPKDIKAAEAVSQAALALTKPSTPFTWDTFKDKVFQFFGGLVMEKKDGKYIVSIGRTAWWLTFLPAVVIWSSSGGSLEAGEALKDISPNHFNTLVVLASYNFGKKVSDTAEKIWAKKGDGPG